MSAIFTQEDFAAYDRDFQSALRNVMNPPNEGMFRGACQALMARARSAASEPDFPFAVKRAAAMLAQKAEWASHTTGGVSSVSNEVNAAWRMWVQACRANIVRTFSRGDIFSVPHSEPPKIRGEQLERSKQRLLSSITELRRMALFGTSGNSLWKKLQSERALWLECGLGQEWTSMLQMERQAKGEAAIVPYLNRAETHLRRI